MTPDWRTKHCAEPAVEAASKATGRDIWGELWSLPGPATQSNRAGPPRSWKEAAELYRRAGATSLAEVVTAVLGNPIAPGEAALGDICMIDGALGVVRGPGAVECIDGYQRIERATVAWSVRGRP